MNLEKPTDLTLEKYHNIVASLSKIDKDAIDDELAHHPTVFSYYYGFMVKAKTAMDKSEVFMETLKSSLKNSCRGAKKCSVAELEDLVSVNQDVVQAANTYRDLEEIYGYTKAICLMLEHKKDMMIQLSANKRMETKTYS